LSHALMAWKKNIITLGGAICRLRINEMGYRTKKKVPNSQKR
jgi:hypothetical protein